MILSAMTHSATIVKNTDDTAVEPGSLEEATLTVAALSIPSSPDPSPLERYYIQRYWLADTNTEDEQQQWQDQYIHYHRNGSERRSSIFSADLAFHSGP